jgi:DNA polymerase-3 subunit delta
MSDARTGDLAPVYVLAGGERFLLDRAALALRDATVPEAARSLAMDVIDGTQASCAEVAEKARTLPMLFGGARRRFVLVRDADGLASGGKDPAPLLAYLDAPADTTVLVLVAEKADQRSKLFGEVKKRGLLIKLDPPPPRQLSSWVQKEASTQGVSMSDGAAVRLSETVGRDLGRLAQAIVQLGLYADGRQVTSGDVDELIADTRERTIFELTDAVGAGDPGKTLRAVRRLLAQRESAVGAVAMLSRHVRQLMRARELGRASQAEAASQLGVPPFVVDTLRAQARRFDEAGLRRALLLCVEADRALKGPPRGAVGEEALLERLCLRLTALAAPARSGRRA